MVSIKAQSITKVYSAPYKGTEKIVAIKDVSIDIYRGSKTIIHGPTGSGKSTLISMLMGLLPPTRGTLYYDGLNVSEASEKALSTFRVNNFGYIPQNPLFIHDFTVIENIISPHTFLKRKYSKLITRTYELLERFTLFDKSKSYITQLSGGEKRKVMILRAVIKNPLYLFADEPLAELDDKSAQSIIELFEELNAHGTSLIIASHIPIKIPGSYDSYRLDRGSIIEYERY